MGCEHPGRVHVVVRVAPADPGGEQAADGAERAVPREVAQKLHAGVVAPLVHHEQPLARRGRKAVGGGGVVRQRLLDEDRHAALERVLDYGRVRGGRRRDHDAVHLRQLPHAADDRVRALGSRHALRRARDDAHAAVEREQVAQDVPPPASAAGQADPRASTHRKNLTFPGMRPLIGITTYLTRARFGSWEEESALVPADYVRAVERAGGRALLVPPSEDGVEETLDALDGVVFSGGSDLDPSTYGQEPHEATGGIVEERDRAELALLQAALARDMPVLAVCRGSQVLNVALGGDLVQHLPDVVGDEKHKELPGEFAEHGVALDPETKLGGLLGEHAPVKSHHHQGFGRLGDGLREAARADDGTIEALEDPSRRFTLGVLWHPEAGEDMRLFEALVREARDYRATR